MASRFHHQTSAHPHPGAGSPLRRWGALAVLVGSGVAVGACGSDDDAAEAPTPATDAAPDSAAEPADTDADPADAEELEQPTPESVATVPAPSTSAAVDLPVSSGAGTAVVTIGDMTTEFSGLNCYFGTEAAELAGDDDVSFGAAAEGDGTGLAITVTETVGVDMLEVYFQPAIGSGELWYTNATQIDPLEAYTFEDNRVATEGDFDLVIDSQEVRTEAGSMEAICR